MAQPQPHRSCIVILGIKGTELADIYALLPGTTWSMWVAVGRARDDMDFGSLALGGSRF